MFTLPKFLVFFVPSFRFVPVEVPPGRERRQREGNSAISAFTCVFAKRGFQVVAAVPVRKSLTYLDAADRPLASALRSHFVMTKSRGVSCGEQVGVLISPGTCSPRKSYPLS
jgi:hypothetical protein